MIKNRDKKIMNFDGVFQMSKNEELELIKVR